MLRKIIAGLGALLALFHVWLFAGQVWSGRLAEPGPILRWLVAFALIGALAGLRRRGLSLIAGRQAVAVWLLAVLLHGPALAARIEDGFAPMVPEVIATVSQVAAGVLGLVLGVSLRISTGRFRLAPAALRLSVLRAFCVCQAARTVRAGYSPRPPPRL